MAPLRDTPGVALSMQKRDAILAGAVKVFTQKGFASASMDRIAEVAGVSKRTVYNHFPSKEILFQAIVADFIQRHDDKKPTEYSPTRPLETQLKEFVDAEIYLIGDPTNRALSRLLTSTFLMDTAFGDQTRRQFEPHAAFIRWLNDAKADGALDFPTPELAAKVFYGLVEGCLTWNALLTDGETLTTMDPILDEMIRVFLRAYAHDTSNGAHSQRLEPPHHTPRK